MRPLPDSPLTVAYGAGVDSTAMLIGLHARGVKPSLILFADTGAEKPGTYAYIPVFDAWLRERGLPGIVTVRYVPKRAPYSTLEGECARNETLPSLAFGLKTCSLKWKKAPQDAYKETWPPAIEAWAAGRKVVTAVGLDAGPQDSKRACKYWGGASADDPLYHVWHPLRDWGWDRHRCEVEILDQGLPLPPKSACFFCPASRPEEIARLADESPDLFERAIRMEDRARSGKHKVGTGSTKGLGRRYAWRDLAEAQGILMPEEAARVGA